MKNECCSPLHFYFYVDYEQVDSLPENTLYFHALWNRECPTDGIPSSARSRHMEWIMGGEQDKHLSAEGNYVPGGRPRAVASMSAATSTSIIWKTAASGTGSGG